MLYKYYAFYFHSKYLVQHCFSSLLVASQMPCLYPEEEKSQNNNNCSIINNNNNNKKQSYELFNGHSPTANTSRARYISKATHTKRKQIHLQFMEQLISHDDTKLDRSCVHAIYNESTVNKLCSRSADAAKQIVKKRENRGGCVNYRQLSL